MQRIVRVHREYGHWLGGIDDEVIIVQHTLSLHGDLIKRTLLLSLHLTVILILEQGALRL